MLCGSRHLRGPVVFRRNTNVTPQTKERLLHWFTLHHTADLLSS